MINMSLKVCNVFISAHEHENMEAYIMSESSK